MKVIWSHGQLLQHLISQHWHSAPTCSVAPLPLPLICPTPALPIPIIYSYAKQKFRTLSGGTPTPTTTTTLPFFLQSLHLPRALPNPTSLSVCPSRGQPNRGRHQHQPSTRLSEVHSESGSRTWTPLPCINPCRPNPGGKQVAQI
jgi:hypothetical protein